MGEHKTRSCWSKNGFESRVDEGQAQLKMEPFKLQRGADEKEENLKSGQINYGLVGVILDAGAELLPTQFTLGSRWDRKDN